MLWRMRKTRGIAPKGIRRLRLMWLLTSLCYFIMKREGSISPKTASISNGNNPRWIILSMEIVALYVPVLTGKNEEHTPLFYEIVYSIYALTVKPLPIWPILGSGSRILVSCRRNCFHHFSGFYDTFESVQRALIIQDNSETQHWFMTRQ
jgi:hypothetical protein